MDEFIEQYNLEEERFTGGHVPELMTVGQMPQGHNRQLFRKPPPWVVAVAVESCGFSHCACD